MHAEPFTDTLYWPYVIGMSLLVGLLIFSAVCFGFIAWRYFRDGW